MGVSELVFGTGGPAALASCSSSSGLMPALLLSCPPLSKSSVGAPHAQAGLDDTPPLPKSHFVVSRFPAITHTFTPSLAHHFLHPALPGLSQFALAILRFVSRPDLDSLPAVSLSAWRHAIHRQILHLRRVTHSPPLFPRVTLPHLLPPRYSTSPHVLPPPSSDSPHSYRPTTTSHGSPWTETQVILDVREDND